MCDSLFYLNLLRVFQRVSRTNILKIVIKKLHKVKRLSKLHFLNLIVFFIIIIIDWYYKHIFC